MNPERRNPRSVDIDLFPTERILKIINAEDALVASAVAATIPEVAKVVDVAVQCIRNGGHAIYAGTGTSGRMAIVDAVECPPTFGTPPEWVQSVIAGGTKAFTQSIEGSEDDPAKAAADLRAKKLSKNDLVIGIAASGTTPYTLAALEFAKGKGAKTAALVCVENSTLSKIADFTICTAVGPEIIAGSTRMKAGTAQKLVLNMFSTTLMINVGMTNHKLRSRGKNMLQEIPGVKPEQAEKLVEASGSNLKVAVIMGATGCDRKEAEKQLAESKGNLRAVLGHLGSGRE